MNQIRFFVAGMPKTAGSKRGFVNKKTGKVIMQDMSGKAGTDWRHDVKCVARDAYDGPPLEGALKITVVFRLPRPASHFRKNGSLTPRAPVHPIVQPDVTKMLRALEDALTKIIWKDDAQIVGQSVAKAYCDDANPTPGALVIIQKLD